MGLFSGTPMADPALTAAQILALQCLFYIFFGLFSVLSDLIFSATITADQVFASSLVSFSTAGGRAVLLASVLNAALSYVTIL